MAEDSQVETIQFRIPSNPRYAATVRRAIRSVADSLGFPHDIADDIELSVDEAVVNAIQHGSSERKQNTVEIVCRVADNKLMIDVRDEGPRFDLPPIEVTSCKLCEATLDEHGRGLRLIYQLMDNVKISHTARGSRIRMVKVNRSENLSEVGSSG